MRNYAGTCKGICSYNLVYNFLIQLWSLKSLVSVVHFLNAFWHGNKAFLKGSSQNAIVPPLVFFHLPYSKQKGVNICFYSCRYQNQIFHLCRTHAVRVALVSHLYRTRYARVSLVSQSCPNRVALVSLLSHSCRSCLALVLYQARSICEVVI